jgi:hypothetical protein
MWAYKNLFEVNIKESKSCHLIKWNHPIILGVFGRLIKVIDFKPQAPDVTVDLNPHRDFNSFIQLRK